MITLQKLLYKTTTQSVNENKGEYTFHETVLVETL